MRIEKVDVKFTSPSGDFVTLKFTTSDGVVGLADATLNVRELAVASYLREHLAPSLLGRQANNIEATWQCYTTARTGAADLPRSGLLLSGLSRCSRQFPWRVSEVGDN